MIPPAANLPGQSPACVGEREERKALADEIKAIREEIGEAPDPTAPASQRDGSGIKGTLSRILGALARVESKVDDLNKSSRSTPPPSRELAKKIGWGLLLIFLAVGEARSLYAQIKGAQGATPSSLTTGKP